MIAIIDYGAGNLTSVSLAFEALNVCAEITNAPIEGVEGLNDVKSQVNNGRARYPYRAENAAD